MRNVAKNHDGGTVVDDVVDRQDGSWVRVKHGMRVQRDTIKAVRR